MKRPGGILVAVVLVLVFASPASATTFCVPGFHAACPNAGGNVAQANLETAMQSNATDGIADRIVVDNGTQTNADSFTTTGTDSLEIVGAGPAMTRLTTSSTMSIFVVNLDGGTRAVTMRDLTIVIPASIPDGAGVGAQARQDTFLNVNVESVTNDHLTGILFIGGGTFEDGSFYGILGGTLDGAARVNPAASGPLNIRRTTFSQSDVGVSVDVADIPTTLSRVRIDAPTQSGASVSNGGLLTVENSVITDPGQVGIDASTNSTATVNAVVRNSTIARVTGSIAATPLLSRVLNVAGFGNSSMSVTGTIVRGFTNAYSRTAPTSAMVGNAFLVFGYSNFGPGASTGDGNLSLTVGNIDQNPLFAGANDFHLLSGSPSIDAASPTPSEVLVEDFDGAFRPCDGNGDGIARDDMGAYERQVVGGCPPVASPPPVQPGTPTPTTPRKCKKPKKKKKGKKAAAAKKKGKKKKKCAK